MNVHKLELELSRLNEMELFGKRYLDKFGKPLNYSQYLLLTRYAKNDLPSLDFVNSPAFEAECNKLEQMFITLYRKDGLSEQDFIRAACGIEIEKLLRYVHIPAHSHGFLELVFVFSGICYHTVGNQCFEQRAGSFTIVHSLTKHELSPSDDCLCLTVKVRADTFLSFHIPNMPYFSVPICFNCGDDLFMRETLLRIYHQQENEHCYHAELISLLLQTLLVYCMQNYRDTLTFLYAGPQIQGKMLDICNYMFENYQNITLRGLAQHFAYTEPYLCKLFRDNFKQSFSEILRNFKLNRAQNLLQTTNLKLDVICDSIGYSDTTQFIRDFKKQYGITPAKYRKQFLQEESAI